MTDVNFSLSACLDRCLFWQGGKSVRYVVARVSASKAMESKRTPLNIALVIDVSGSMGGGKLVAAKQAALGLAKRLGSDDRLTLVSFASDVHTHLDAVPVTPENLPEIMSEISRLRTRGATDLSGGWFAGVDCAARIAERDVAMTPRVIILSDGHANKGITNQAELFEHAGELRMRGVLTSALGIGDGYDEQLLRGIAENGGGRLHDAELTQEIGSVLLGELDDIFGTVADAVTISLKAPRNVEVVRLGAGRSTKDGDAIHVDIGPVQNGIERMLVFRITCPEADVGQEIELELNATARAVGEDTLLRAVPLNLTLRAADRAENGRQFRDASTAEAVAKLWHAEIVATAARTNRERARQGAADHVGKELGHFRRYVEGLAEGPRLVRELELLARRVGEEFSPRMSKELVIQASLMMESREDRRGPGKASWSARMERGE